MANYAEQLKLNPEVVETLADVYFGYASYEQEDNAKSNMEYTASNMLIAAIFRSIVRPADSRTAFRDAANLYWILRNPYYKIVAICGLHDQLLFQGQEDLVNKSFDPDEYFMNYLSWHFLRSRDNNEIASEADIIMPATQVGRLGIPFSLYVAAFRELSAEDSDSFNAISTILNIAGEQTRLQQLDSYHWNDLRGNIIPIEPEIIATCICAIQLTRQRQSLTERLSENINNNALVPLLIAEDILYGR